jgi:hypothetical protein
VPELAASKVIERFGPDVVVGNSVRRATWETVVSMCRAAAIPTVLYVREEDSLAYFDGAAPPGDAFVANARSLRESVSRTGVECAFIPSVIETGPTRTESLRRTALVVNPVESRGASIVERIARAVPEVSFVVQESWPLGPTELRWVETHLASLPNVEFRRAGPPGSGLYGDARVLLVPYRVDNRPRVIAEAQANGIPVIVGDVPALREALGDGGLVVPLEDVGEWAAAIRRAFDDATWYGDLVEGARIHSRRDEIAPHLVAQAFVDLLSGVLERHGVGR